MYVCPDGHVVCAPHLEDLQRVRGTPTGRVPCDSCDARPPVVFRRMKSLEQVVSTCREASDSMAKEQREIVTLREEVDRLRIEARSEARVEQVTKLLRMKHISI